MKVTHTSVLSGIERTRDLPITDEQIAAYRQGMLLQDAFPNLSDDDREFFLTGITHDEWDAEFPDDDNDEFGNDEPAF